MRRQFLESLLLFSAFQLFLACIWMLSASMDLPFSLDDRHQCRWNSTSFLMRTETYGTRVEGDMLKKNSSTSIYHITLSLWYLQRNMPDLQWACEANGNSLICTMPVCSTLILFTSSGVTFMRTKKDCQLMGEKRTAYLHVSRIGLGQGPLFSSTSVFVLRLKCWFLVCALFLFLPFKNSPSSSHR